MLSFEQTMMGFSPRCYIPSFVEIGQLVLGKMFKWFLPYMDIYHYLVSKSSGRHLLLEGMSPFYNVREKGDVILKAYIQNLDKNGLMPCEKSKF